MEATTRAQNVVAIAQWYGIAKMFPQKHPLELDEISAYTTRYGATPDGPDSAPWCYQQDPENVTPQNWQPPRTGLVNKYGSDPTNDLDPTSPAFVEPPAIP